VLGDSVYSDWALYCVKDICPIVGISCGGREEQTFSLASWYKRLQGAQEFVELHKLQCQRRFKPWEKARFIMSNWTE
jgi:hypothetical protein